MYGRYVALCSRHFMNLTKSWIIIKVGLDQELNYIACQYYENSINWTRKQELNYIACQNSENFIKLG
jgi:hypothetical protein